MGFGDLKKAAGLSALNDYLADRSFIEGYTVSQGDVVVFQAMSGAPSADLFNALRWYNQVKSYSSQFSSLPGVKKSVSEYGSSGDKKPAAAAAADDDDDSDVDLFGDDDDDEADLKAMQEEKKKAAAAAAEASKKKKKTVVAKSTIVLDVKPWDDETDMADVEKKVRSITMDGLLWKASKLIPVGYGIVKLQISCVVEDDKVGTDDLEEQITSFEDLIQSMDIVAFNKI